MAQKKLTLPKDFKQILDRNDLNELKAVYETCDINAYERGSYKTPALCMYGISVEFIDWLVQHGANIDAKNSYERTALYIQAGLNQVEKVKKLLELGADIHTTDTYHNTVLHSASYRYEIVKLLLENGADPLAENDRGYTPLQEMLSHCENANIVQVAKVAQMLLDAGDKVSQFAQEQVARIGKSFEFYRKNFNTELLSETEQALQTLYSLFHVTPISPRKEYDGVSPITVQADSWQNQFNQLWDWLVPGSGHANTVQGEVIRICGKVSREILDNGACNWSRSYRKLPQALARYVAMGNPIRSCDKDALDPATKQSNKNENDELITLAKSIDASSCEDTLYRLCELAVKWVLANPEPIKLDKVPYDR